MSDPFRPQANNQLVREARIGLTILAVTLGVFCYIAFQRISGAGTQIPQHVLNGAHREICLARRRPDSDGSEEIRSRGPVDVWFLDFQSPPIIRAKF